MTILHNTVKAYLLANSGVTSSPCGTRVYVDTWLPTGYQLADGAALVIKSSGGPGTNLYQINNETIVTRAFADNEADSTSIDDAVFEAFKLTSQPSQAASIYVKDNAARNTLREEGGMYVTTREWSVAEVL